MNFPAGKPLFGPESRPRLIVNADDFGISKSINDGILRAHEEGVVTSTSLMAVGRAFDHAVALCRSTPSLDVGVHLTLVAEKPLLKQRFSRVRNNGCFPAGISMLLTHLLNRRIRLADIQAEWAAQIERILDCGIRVTHLDSHQHLHALPGISRLTRELACIYRIPFVRIPIEDGGSTRPLSCHGFFRMGGAMALRVSCILGGLHRRKADRFESPRFLGFQEGGRLDLASLERLLRALQPGKVYELMCHPGLTPEEMDVRQWNYRHQEELAALTSPAIRSQIAARDIQLSSFADLSHHSSFRPCRVRKST